MGLGETFLGAALAILMWRMVSELQADRIADRTVEKIKEEKELSRL